MLPEVMGEFQKAAGMTLVGMTLQTQRELARQWFGPWFLVPGGAEPAVAGGLAARIRAWQRPWAGAVNRVLEKRRETIDTQCQAGIKLVAGSFKVGEAKDPEQIRQRVEELWTQSITALRTVAEAQVGELRTAVQECSEASSQSLAAVAG